MILFQNLIKKNKKPHTSARALFQKQFKHVLVENRTVQLGVYNKNVIIL